MAFENPIPPLGLPNGRDGIFDLQIRKLQVAWGMPF
jgi:hypothetical protein